MAPPAQAVAVPSPTDLDGFLASVERRAFRVAELALGQREDALDAVQDAMVKLLRYRERPPGEWTPLFWSILRSQITDRHRRNGIRRRFVSWFGRDDQSGEDPMAALPDPGLDPVAALAATQSRERGWLVPSIAVAAAVLAIGLAWRQP